jgi:hypothetical protein
MSGDLVERLRSRGEMGWRINEEAADEIERLRAERSLDASSHYKVCAQLEAAERERDEATALLRETYEGHWVGHEDMRGWLERVRVFFAKEPKP